MASSNGNLNEFVTALSGIDAPRALLVTLNDNGQLDYKPLSQGLSLLNIKTDLMNHINEYPHTDEWLASIRDQIDERLAAGDVARATGGVCSPRQGGGWDIIRVKASENEAATLKRSANALPSKNGLTAGENEFVTLSHARKIICLEAAWELESLAQLLPNVVPNTDDAPGAHHAVRGISGRIKSLSGVLMSGLDDNACTIENLEREVMVAT